MESGIHLLETVAILAIDIRAIRVSVILLLAHRGPNVGSFLYPRTSETDTFFHINSCFWIAQLILARADELTTSTSTEIHGN